MAVLQSWSTRATPPIRNSVMLRTLTPSRRATSAWPSSCSRTETNSSREVLSATSQGIQAGAWARLSTRAGAVSVVTRSWNRTVVIATIANQLG